MSHNDTPLERRTRDHWDNRSDNRIQDYIRTLLGDEMSASNQIIRDDCDVLVLLVGFSPDPLLQSIYVYRPRRIILLLNNKYNDREASVVAGEYQDYIAVMRELKFCRSEVKPKHDKDIFWSEKDATTQWVFTMLCKQVLPEQQVGKRIVVDITGAKKNMVAGAFLFADYSGADINYVDFGKYDSFRGRPFGYTAIIGKQPNPSEILSLRDWARVRQLFMNFSFRAAARELTVIHERMKSDYFEAKDRSAVTRLQRLAQVLEQWDNGDYTAAWKLWEQPINQPINEDQPSLSSQLDEQILPPVIKLLSAAGWPSTETSNPQELYDLHRSFKRGATPEKSIFHQHEVFLGYASDELAKIGRLIEPNEDFRSAFLRSAALHELLLKARVALLWFAGHLSHQKEIGERRCQPVHKDDLTFCYWGITDYHSAGNIRGFLSGKYTALRNVRYDEEHREGKKRLQHCYTITHKIKIADERKLTYLDEETALDSEIMEWIRNESIHTHLSIPLELAQQAHTLASAAVQDYIDNWLKKPLTQQDYTLSNQWSPDWWIICTACGVADFLPQLEPQTRLNSTEVNL